MDQKWLRIGHRGAAGTAPEHTLAGFERALRLGVDMIELDVQLSRDGELVVMHDLTLERTTTGTGPVRLSAWPAIQRLDAGSWFGPEFAGQAPLRLQDVVTVVGARGRLNVEIKAPSEDWQELSRSLVALLQRRGLLRSTLISCFEPGALAVVRQRSAEVAIGVLWQQADFTEAWRWAAELRAVAIHPHWVLARPELIAMAHARELQVITWTVNEVATMRTFVQYGIDGIITDFPERFAEVERQV